ncbi:MAG: 50S ribosomal protein L25 [Bacteroidetes bacterium]|nr:50S ribosomal protein L25 [Bacteroidota bacterium]
MSEVTLHAEIRTQVGKQAKVLRRQGKVPGIFYGHKMQNIPIALPELVLKPLYTSSATNIINLQLNDGSKYLCVLRDVQFDPVTDRPIHFDFQGLNENEEITLEIPVRLIGGTPKGVREGGILQHVLHKLKIACLPKNIPEHVEINVEALEINKSIHVKDISIPNVRILESESSTIVAVIPPAVHKEAAGEAVPGETPTEPEVIAKGKKPEESGNENP